MTALLDRPAPTAAHTGHVGGAAALTLAAAVAPGWAALALALPVVLWGAVIGVRRGAAGVEGLCSAASVAALTWVVVAGPDTAPPLVAAMAALAAMLARPAAEDPLAGPVAAIVATTAVATLGFWLGAGTAPAPALAATVAVLLVGSPVLLAIARPAGRDPVAAAVDTAIFTGLATGTLEVREVHVATGVAEGDVLRLAGAVARRSPQPLAGAVADAAGADLPDVAEFDVLPGLGARGVVAEVDGPAVRAHAVLVGRAGLLAEHGIDLPPALAAIRPGPGTATVAVAWDGVARAVLTVVVGVRPGAAAAVARLRAAGVDPWLLPGAADTGAAVANAAGIPPGSVLGDGVPELAAVAALEACGRVVAVVDQEGAERLCAARRAHAGWRRGRAVALGFGVLALPPSAAGVITPTAAGLALAACGTAIWIIDLRARRHRRE